MRKEIRNIQYECLISDSDYSKRKRHFMQTKPKKLSDNIKVELEDEELSDISNDADVEVNESEEIIERMLSPSIQPDFKRNVVSANHVRRFDIGNHHMR